MIDLPFWANGLYPILTSAILVIFLCLLALAFVVRSVRRALFMAVAFLVLLIVLPVRWMTAFDYIHSVVGPLSAGFVSYSLFGGLAFLRQKKVVRHKDELLFSLLIFCLGAGLYLSTLGYIPWSVYALGFDTNSMLAGLGTCLVLAIVCHSLMTAVWVAIGCVLWVFNLIPSKNLWDFFIDPIAWITAAVLVFSYLANAFGRAIPYYGLRMSSRPGENLGRQAAPDGGMDLA